MQLKAKYFVTEEVNCHLVSTQFDDLDKAKIYRNAQRHRRTLRLPKEVAFTANRNGVFSDALFSAVEALQ